MNTPEQQAPVDETTKPKEKLTLTAILTEIKHLRKWLDDNAENTQQSYVYLMQPAGQVCHGTSIKPADADKHIKAHFDRYDGKRQRLDRLRRTLLLANATVKVTLPGGQQVTIIEAVDIRQNKALDRKWVNARLREYQGVQKAANDINQRIDLNTEQNITSLRERSKTDTTVGETLETQIRVFEDVAKANKVSLVDPIKIYDKLIARKNELDDLDQQLDMILSVANAGTVVELVD